jgi:hypothetical protein
LATATPIVPSTTTTNAFFEVTGDVDWFTFTAEAGHIYEFTCNSGVINCNAYLTDAAGTTLVSDTGTGLSARVRWKLDTAGTYYVRTVAASWSTSTDYTYQLQDLGVDAQGDTQATATPVVPSTTNTSAAIEAGNDQDWFSFSAAAGQSFDFFCTTTAFNCDLFLYDAAGTLLTSDTATTANAQVTRRFATAGTYYVRLISGSGAYGNYSYRLNDRGVDQHSDTFAGATVLTLGTATPGTIEIAGDLDFFAVNLVSGTSYTVTPTGITLSILVYAPNQSTLLYNGAGPGTFTATGGTATYYVRVTGASSGTGAYTIKVQ